MFEVRAYATPGLSSPLGPFTVARREPGAKDVVIEIDYCGICHSDVHQARDEWGNAIFPMVPGHEIVGRVTKVGRRVTKFQIGDTVGVGCMVDSCRKCRSCKQGLEQHCLTHVAFTYNGTEQDQKTPTFGGYSTHIVVDEAFVLRVSPKLPLERVAPLLCAGITTYSPLKRAGVGRRSRVGVMGLGGLGHMGVKISAAMGAEVAVLSHSPGKAADAKRLGAGEFILTSNPKAVAPLAGSFDVILDTVSSAHDIGAVLSWLKSRGTLILVGASPEPLPLSAMPLILGSRNLSGSLIGGIAETQEMLDFCAKKKVLADVEVIPIGDVNAAYDRLVKNDVRYRFVIDLKSL